MNDDDFVNEERSEPALLSISDAVLASLRTLGLYEDSVIWHPDEESGKFILALTLYVGDVAFTTRVQDLSQHNVDQEFADMTHSLRDDAFKEMRRQIASGELTID